MFDLLYSISPLSHLIFHLFSLHLPIISPPQKASLPSLRLHFLPLFALLVSTACGLLLPPPYSAHARPHTTVRLDTPRCPRVPPGLPSPQWYHSSGTLPYIYSTLLSYRNLPYSLQPTSIRSTMASKTTKDSSCSLRTAREQKSCRLTDCTTSQRYCSLYRIRMIPYSYHIPILPYPSQVRQDHDLYGAAAARLAHAAHHLLHHRLPDQGALTLLSVPKKSRFWSKLHTVRLFLPFLTSPCCRPIGWRDCCFTSAATTRPSTTITPSPRSPPLAPPPPLPTVSDTITRTVTVILSITVTHLPTTVPLQLPYSIAASRSTRNHTA